MSNYIAKCIICGEDRVLKNKPKPTESGKCKKCWMKEKNTTHGKSDTRLYSIWTDMKKRCSNKNHVMYKYYGGQGISVCEEWNKFENFYEWSTNNGYLDFLEIDRIKSNLNYEPSNCKWSTREEQMQNTRKIYAHNTSGYRGVHLRKPKNDNQKPRWYAQVSVNNKKIGLGSYSSDIEAAKAYDKYVLENKLNHTINGV